MWTASWLCVCRCDYPFQGHFAFPVNVTFSFAAYLSKFLFLNIYISIFESWALSLISITRDMVLDNDSLLLQVNICLFDIYYQHILQQNNHSHQRLQNVHFQKIAFTNLVKYCTFSDTTSWAKIHIRWKTAFHNVHLQSTRNWCLDLSKMSTLLSKSLLIM